MWGSWWLDLLLGLAAGLLLAWVVLLLAYLAFPFDLVPDFIPVLGYADDAIIVAAVLRRVAAMVIAAALIAWAGRGPGPAARLAIL